MKRRQTLARSRDKSNSRSICCDSLYLLTNGGRVLVTENTGPEPGQVVQPPFYAGFADILTPFIAAAVGIAAATGETELGADDFPAIVHVKYSKADQTVLRETLFNNQVKVRLTNDDIQGADDC